jgi:hypothetical protein
MYTGRTAKYVEAMIKEGDKFDYAEWLSRVQQEDAKLKSTHPLQLDAPTPTESNQAKDPAVPPASIKGPDAWHGANHGPDPWASGADAAYSVKEDDRSQKSIRQRLGDVCNAWDLFQENRARDAIYRYLGAVFWTVKDWGGQRRTRKLVRRAFKFAGVLPVDMNADPFAVVIRCTCEDAVDHKTVSKWSRALRFAAKRKTPGLRLKSFMKSKGGINRCASLWAEHVRSGNEASC